MATCYANTIVESFPLSIYVRVMGVEAHFDIETDLPLIYLHWQLHRLTIYKVIEPKHTTRFACLA